MPLCVVLDTNMWLKHPMLRPGLGVALLHLLPRGNGRLGLPEVVEQEVLQNAVRRGSELANEIDMKIKQLRAFAGSAYDVPLPSSDALRERVTGRMEELDTFFLRVPFTLEHAKAALRRVLDETPPSGPKNQQFKDSLIWEAVLDLAREHDVHFVTEDRGFFFKRQHCSRLAKELDQECKDVGVAVSIYHKLGDCLKVIGEEVPSLNDLPFRDAIRDWAVDFGEPYASQKTFEVTDIGNPRCTFFATDDSNILAADFKIDLGLADWSEDVGRVGGCLSIIGEAKCSLSEDTCIEITPHMLSFEWVDPDGSLQRPRILLMATASDLKFRERPYRVREPIE